MKANLSLRAAAPVAGVLLGLLALPTSAATLRLNWTLAFSYPPNPCNEAATLSSLMLGLFEPGSRAGEYLPLVPNPGPPDLPADGRAAGSQIFAAADGTSIYGAYRGAVWCPNPGPPDLAVYAFPAGTETGDPLLGQDPGAAPYVLLGMLREGAWIPSPGPLELPLFAFASPGLPAGTLSLLLSPIPEPGTAALVLAGLAAVASLRRGRCAPAPAKARANARRVRARCGRVSNIEEPTCGNP